jgi:PAP2 superfamily
MFRRRHLGALRECVLIAAAYFGGELFRGLADGGAATATQHAHAIVRLERRLHVFGEADVQRAVHHITGLPTFLGYAYLTAHLALTAVVLVWVYRRRRYAYARLRNTLVLANAIGVVGYTSFPTAPPRLAGVGVADTVSGATSINLSSSLVSSFYNPYAAFPSMHIGFALIAGAAVWRLARRPVWRVAGAAYPLFVLLVIVATGNHFFLDAAAGAAVAALAAAVVHVAMAPRAARRAPETDDDELALARAA